MPHDVFISHAARDRAVANALCAELESKRIRCWIAPRDVVPGTDFQKSIVDAIASSRLIVVVFSSGANDSPYVHREVGLGVEEQIPIVPFRIEEVVPSDSMKFCLGGTHWLDAMTPPLEDHLSRLGEVVERLLVEIAPLEQRDSSGTGEVWSTPGILLRTEPVFEFRSDAEVFGIPVVHIIAGTSRTDASRQRPRGIIAIGDSARGIVAIGTSAIGLVALGAVATGVISVGFVSIGVVSVGALAVGVAAAWGFVALAPLAIGYFAAGYAANGTFGPRVREFESELLTDPGFIVFMVALCMLSYLIPNAVRAWARSVRAARETTASSRRA